jgi:hypothetical protein
MQGAGYTITATVMIFFIFIFLLSLNYKSLRDQSKLSGSNDENPSSSLYYGGGEKGIIDARGENPNQVGGYAGPGVVDEDPGAEWI